MISPARKLCYELLIEIESQRLFSDDALNSEGMQKLDIRDRHLTTEIVYGTLRWQGMLDYMLLEVSSRPWKRVALEVKVLLRMSLYQMWQMDRVPEYAIVNDAVELAKRGLGRGIEGYINGILRSLARSKPWKADGGCRKASPHIRASLPKWLWERWILRFGENASMDFALSLNSQPQAAVRMIKDTDFPDSLPFEVTQSPLVPGAYLRVASTSAPVSGDTHGASFQFQDEGSQLISYLLEPLAGRRVWDACAAPGGKSAILCRLCGESGRIVASDLKSERINRLAASNKSSHLFSTDILVADASQPSPFRDCFDAVLADVPCSGLGTLRRNPEIKWQFQPKEFASLQSVQKKILNCVSETVRLGGRLLYSTCSTEPEENEQVVESFLKTHRNFSLVRPVYPPGIEEWTGKDSMVRTFPSGRLWDGFFAALMTRDA
jgi:16S rRNA (cytosine967-C5)-methyltransferase